MSQNIFAQMKDYIKQPNRNTFDLSFQNNLSMEFGKLYPVFCKDVIPGDSFRITPSFGLRFMPMAFPVQTRMQANLHFFYVRNRNLWKDWPDFIGRTKQGLTLPYIADPSKVAYTRGLGDYLGLPTTLAGNYGVDNTVTARTGVSVYSSTVSNMQSATYGWPSVLGFGATTVYYNGRLQNIYANQIFGTDSVFATLYNQRYSLENIAPKYANPTGESGAYYGMLISNLTQIIQPKQVFCLMVNPNQESGEEQIEMSPNITFVFYRGASGGVRNICARVVNPSYRVIEQMERTVSDSSGIRTYKYQFVEFDLSDAEDYTALTVQGGLYPEKNWQSIKDSILEGTPDSSGRLYNIMILNSEGYVPYSNGQVFNQVPWIDGSSITSLGTQYPVDGMPFSPNTSLPKLYYHGMVNWRMSYADAEVNEIYSVPDAKNLYKSDEVRINALPFRAYESIYNAFYRNQQNDPFTINGIPEYNKFIPTNEGGADTTDYALRYRNWELDFLTSAVQSPQQGIAPLVGVTASGEFTFQDEDGSTFTAQATVGEDGDSITGIQIQSDANNKTPNGAIQTGTLRAMREIITNGISISDFRNVNALQRWLETNMRRGFRYKDQLMSHFGVDAEYKALDMPEFIGGMSEPVQVNQITQTSVGDLENPLGSYAGQASILAQSEHSITHYCDEHGYIIGIMSISPVPNYSQLLPKHFLKLDTLDYFFPEFGHIGMQPITYEEVCPLQSYASGDNVHDDFGYQRAWYDYIQSTDEVHGLMRTELRNFLINRQFDSRPELGPDFLHISPNDVNDVFAVTDVTDKIMGAIWFDVQAKRPIPKFGIPRLEA